MDCGCGSIAVFGGFCDSCNNSMVEHYLLEEAYEKYEIISDEMELIKKEQEQMLKITECKVYPFKGQSSNLKGFAKITLDEQLVIGDIRIMSGQNGLFVAFPSKKNEKDGKWYDSVYPITADLRSYIQKNILEEYSGQQGSQEQGGFDNGDGFNQEPEPVYRSKQSTEEDDLPF